MARTDRCPVCGSPALPEQTPFCGQGCRDRDLLRWLDEGYRLPAHPADPSTVPDGLDSPETPR